MREERALPVKNLSARVGRLGEGRCRCDPSIQDMFRRFKEDPRSSNNFSSNLGSKTNTG